MRAFLIAAIATLISTATTTAASGARTTRAVGCGSGVGQTKYSTTQTIKGKTVIVNCGPATAKLRYKGKTYVFKHGTCFRYLGSFKLNLGRSLLVPATNNANQAYASMTITGAPNGGTEVGAAGAGFSLYIATKWSGAAAKDTFASITNGVTATGSWNCEGPIRSS